MNVQKVTSFLTLSLTYLNFKIRMQSSAKVRIVTLFTSQLQITLYTCTGIGTHSRHVPGPWLVSFDTSGFAEEPPTLSAITSYLKIY